jgi:hypothetical protein
MPYDRNSFLMAITASRGLIGDGLRDEIGRRDAPARAAPQKIPAVVAALVQAYYL